MGVGSEGVRWGLLITQVWPRPEIVGDLTREGVARVQVYAIFKACKMLSGDAPGQQVYKILG